VSVGTNIAAVRTNIAQENGPASSVDYETFISVAFMITGLMVPSQPVRGGPRGGGGGYSGGGAAVPGSSLLTILHCWRTAFKLACERHRQRKQLMEMDDRQLKDIGITPEEAEQEARKPIWKD
jgi:uncharacterized protein YjiS (DUF1127 family)